MGRGGHCVCVFYCCGIKKNHTHRQKTFALNEETVFNQSNNFHWTERWVCKHFTDLTPPNHTPTLDPTPPASGVFFIRLSHWKQTNETPLFSGCRYNTDGIELPTPQLNDTCHLWVTASVSVRLNLCWCQMSTVGLVLVIHFCQSFNFLIDFFPSFFN